MVRQSALVLIAYRHRSDDPLGSRGDLGFVSIEIYKVGSLEFSWKADHPVFRGEDVKPGLCEAALLTEIIPRLQARYDLADD